MGEGSTPTGGREPLRWDHTLCALVRGQPPSLQTCISSTLSRCQLLTQVGELSSASALPIWPRHWQEKRKKKKDNVQSSQKPNTQRALEQPRTAGPSSIKQASANPADSTIRPRGRRWSAEGDLVQSLQTAAPGLPSAPKSLGQDGCSRQITAVSAPHLDSVSVLCCAIEDGGCESHWKRVLLCANGQYLRKARDSVSMRPRDGLQKD